MQLIEDIEMCPKGWTLTTVGDACNICDNLRLPLNVEQRQLMQGEFPYYGPTGVLDYLNEYRLDGTYALIGEDGDHFLKFWVWPMTQLVSGKFNVNNHAHIVQGKGDCLTEWFYLYFHHMCLRPVLTLQGVGRYKLTRQGLEGLPIIVPPVREQKKLVAIIREWTQAANTLSKLIDAKVRFKQGLMQQLLTGKRRFKEFGNEPWSEYHLGDLFTEREETNCVDLPLLSITADRGVIPRSDVDRKDTSNENKSLYKRIAPGDIGYNTMRMWQGVSAVSRYKGIVSPAYTICIPGPNIDADFAGYLFKYPPVVHLFYRFSQGLVDDTLNLKFHHFAQIRVRIPSVKEQKKIAQVFSKCDEEIEVLRKHLDALKQQKKGLMQKLLTGQVRVKS